MGVVASIAAAVGGLMAVFRGGRASKNPVIVAIEDNARTDEAIAQADAARKKAEADAAKARDQQVAAQLLTAKAELLANEAISARKDAEEYAKRIRDEAALRTQEAIASQAREEAAIKALKEATLKAQEDAGKVKRAQDDAYNAIIAQAEAQDKADVAHREAEAAKAETQNANIMQAEAKLQADEAQRAVREARAAKEKAEKDLKDGIQPVEWPTRRELSGAKKTHQYKEGLFHFAIAGISGTGKSSLINAFCGVPNNHPRAASTGIVETTATVARYPDPNPKNPFVWYDVPGAGTLDIPDWRYFNDQGLYVFDCIIVLFDNRFTATDVAILRNCKRFNIPSYLVRSKSNQHIQNIVTDMEHNSDDEDDADNNKLKKRADLLPKARAMFIQETRKNVKFNLAKADLPPQRVYLVSKDDMLTITRGKVSKRFIDEYDLLRDILTEAKERRIVGAADY